MGLTAPTAGVIVGGLDILSQGINAAVTAKQNRLTREFSERMYGRQRADALADFNMQNEYNSPAAQMERLKAAKLNPNLIYGNGTTSTGSSSPVRAANAPAWNPQAPKIDLGSSGSNAITTAMQLQSNRLQNDNLKAQNDLILAQTKKATAETLGTIEGTTGKEFKNNLNLQLRNQILATEWTKLRNLTAAGELIHENVGYVMSKTKTENAIRQPRIESIQASTKGTLQGISESMQRILNMRVQSAKTVAETRYVNQQIANADKDGKLKQLDIDLKNMGTNWSDPAWQRRAILLLKKIGL
ncbi:MAG: DNA pilot protein [Microvirus sp.]|nr:MAG: DNA pilot protein [Microvirus sp.]